MEQLWAPWRVEYIRKAKESGCVLCQKSQETDDEKNFILYRGQHNFMILNTFPYNPGHLMIAPYRHGANLWDLTREEAEEHFELLKKGVRLLQEAMQPSGFNIGLNLGKVAGAGIMDHLHTHIVPRWEGDTNFMPVLSNTRVISEALNSVYGRLKARL